MRNRLQTPLLRLLKKQLINAVDHAVRAVQSCQTQHSKQVSKQALFTSVYLHVESISMAMVYGLHHSQTVLHEPTKLKTKSPFKYKRQLITSLLPAIFTSLLKSRALWVNKTKGIGLPVENVCRTGAYQISEVSRGALIRGALNREGLLIERGAYLIS